MIATVPPCREKASARQMTRVVLPTPPLVEQTLTTAIALIPTRANTHVLEGSSAQMVKKP
jgi:hypothetical protein